MTENNISFFLGKYESPVLGALNKMRRNNVIARIWACDHTVWKPEPDEIVNRLGWLNAPAETLEKLPSIKTTLEPFTNSSIKDVVLLGMGGSSLAADVFNRILGSRSGYPALHILDTTDPGIISRMTQKLEWEKTVFLVSSKSGTTLEVTSLFQYFYNLALKKLGSSVRDRFIFITDKGSAMVEQAKALSLPHVFFSNPDIGGRYSALSLPGIVPAAIIGADVRKLLQNAVKAAQREKAEFFSGNLDPTGCVLGAVMGTLTQKGCDKLTLLMPSRLASFDDWLEQLIAESTGKDGKGIMPVLNEPPTPVQAYGKDRVFVTFQESENDNTTKVEELIAAGHPVITIKLNDNYDLGSQMFLWEMATAVAAHIMGINPFDQPDVEATKTHTSRMIAQYRKTKELPEPPPALATPEYSVYGDIKGSSAVEALAEFLNQVKAGDYVCLQVFLSPSPEIDEALLKLRGAIAAKYRLAVTLGYGPRYLHSTGQLHKGDSGDGLFIQLTANDLIDVDIPDRIGSADSTLTFGTLKAAQAQGDWQALIDAQRRVIRFHFQINPAAGLKTLAAGL
jgi:glucose-6-phosphate isomerase/transaldolase/glucose-6-phosphate isomerase